MRFRTRDLVYVGILGALWGAVEASLGSVLHALRVPFAGLVLSGVGIAIALCGRILVPRAGTIALIGLVTAFLKMLSVGGLVLNAMLGHRDREPDCGGGGRPSPAVARVVSLGWRGGDDLDARSSDRCRQPSGRAGFRGGLCRPGQVRRAESWGCSLRGGAGCRVS